MADSSPLAVLGAGSWGTALALVSAGNGTSTRLWGHNPKHIESLQHERCNSRYLPNVPFPDTLQVKSDLALALQDVQDILLVVPSKAFRATLEACKPHLRSDARIAWGTKGLDKASGQLLHDIVYEVLGDNTPVADLSGPSFAKEVAAHQPTAVTLATDDDVFAQALVDKLHCDTFRIYRSHDILGVQLAGVIKNILAIATGIAESLGLGANARAALVTRGLSEMTRLGIALGGQPETFVGLAGLGDLLLTCSDNQSRNRRFGLALGAGKSKEQAAEEIGQIVEGAANTDLIMQLAKQHHIDMPITEQVWRILENQTSPQEALQNLMQRDARVE